nr:LysE family transporter [Haloferula luteola]
MAIGQFSPGPDWLLVTRTALSEGTGNGVRTAAGIATGLVFHVGLAVGGLAGIFRTEAAWGKAVACLGAAYLLWMVVGLLRHAGEIPELGEIRSRGEAYLRGFLTNLLNPKVVLFVVATTSPFLAGDHPRWWPWAIGGIVIAQGFLLWCLWAWLLQWPPVKQGYRRAAKWIDRVFAGLLVILAVVLVLECVAI